MNIPQAKADLPRVELEVTVSLDNSFAAKLNGVDKAFHQQVTDQVMSKGDVGLRFYPVLSDEYARSQTRPQYRMTVELGSLDFTVTETARKSKEGVIKIHRWVSRVSCTATTALRKHRRSRPPLLVDRAQTKVNLSLTQPKFGTSVSNAMRVKDKTKGKLLEIPRESLLRTVDSSVHDSLRQMITAIDRELFLQRRPMKTAKPGAKPAPAK